jgi:hypothetical protein
MVDEIATPTDDLDRSASEEGLVRAWRSEQLRRLGLPFVLADAFADVIDWRALSALIERGCPVGLALQIVR